MSCGGGEEDAIYDGVSLRGPDCCGGGTFHGHQSFCDVGHVKAERADHEYVESLRKSIEDKRAYTDHLTLVNADLKRKLEATELVILCAQDIVDGWPTLTFRTISGMTNKVDTLKQALEAVNYLGLKAEASEAI